jgi:glucosylceramidase
LAAPLELTTFCCTRKTDVTSRLRRRLNAFLLLLTPTLCAQSVRVVATTANLSETLAPQPDLRFSTGVVPDSEPVIEVDETQHMQTMDGFGAAMTEGSAWLLEEKLPLSLRSATMTRLFSQTRGAGLSFVRLPLGATDLSRSQYTNDDMPAGQSDPALARFSLAHDRADVLPAMRQALQLNPRISVMLTPWSAPAWMKSPPTKTPEGTPTLDGGQLRDDKLGVYAEYLTRSVKAFQDAGVPIRFLSVQNEPLNETRNYPGALMSAVQQAKLIGDYLGPDLRRARLSTKVLAYDHNWDHPEYPIAVLSDASAAPFLAGTAVHCYGGDVRGQDAIHQRFPQEGIWLTECSGGSWQRETPLLATAHLLIDATRHWAKSVSLWAIALDTDHGPHAGGCATCRGLVTVDLHASPATVTYNGDFYALAQASMVVLAGATRIGSTSFGRDGLETVAFQNVDGSVALLVLNNRAEPATFRVRSKGNVFAATLASGALASYRWAPAQSAKTPETR